MTLPENQPNNYLLNDDFVGDQCANLVEINEMVEAHGCEMVIDVPGCLAVLEVQHD